MTQQVKVSEDKYRGAIKLLMGLGCDGSLSRGDQRFLESFLRGPFVKGMSTQQAEQVLQNAGWSK